MTDVTPTIATVTWEVVTVPCKPVQDLDVTAQPCSLRVSLSWWGETNSNPSRENRRAQEPLVYVGQDPVTMGSSASMVTCSMCRGAEPRDCRGVTLSLQPADCFPTQLLQVLQL